MTGWVVAVTEKVIPFRRVQLKSGCNSPAASGNRSVAWKMMDEIKNQSTTGVIRGEATAVGSRWGRSASLANKLSRYEFCQKTIREIKTDTNDPSVETTSLKWTG
ncbi:hypothetical protein WH47_00840 [Habropoda laboriosa]|uniref:Uncharacterized protein n=1 Tax=Habropoda laboriosa TaxID=597456 RepID=A0A0L7R864_9HYME|nr:hypothetical protein WH47_00840 [Habropoda laboriosa]